MVELDYSIFDNNTFLIAIISKMETSYPLNLLSSEEVRVKFLKLPLKPWGMLIA